MSEHIHNLECNANGDHSLTAQSVGDVLLDLLSKLSLASTIVIVPLMAAWAKEWSVAVLFLSSASLLVANSIGAMRAKAKPGRSLVPVYLAGIACLLVLVQLVPLPALILDRVSPFQRHAFSDWPEISSALATPSRWATISLTPHLTASSLALVCGYFMFVMGLWFHLQSKEEVRWLLRLIAFSTVVMAVVGLLQLLFGNGKFLGLFENPMRSAGWPAKGTFTNQNHFASFLALGVGCCLFQCLGTRKTKTSSDRSKARSRGDQSSFGNQNKRDAGSSSNQAIWAAATIIVLLAAVLSFSRGGIASVLIALGVVCVGFRSKLRVLSGFLLPAMGFCVLGVLAFGSDSFSAKWNQLLTSTSFSDVSAPRAALWNSVLEASPSFAVAGSGAGSHAEVYPVWMEEDFGKRFSHAENGYLQILLEMGVPGILLLCLLYFVVGRRTVRALRIAKGPNKTLLFVCAAGITASVLHSIVDFVWCIPACLVVTLALLMSLYRSTEFLENRERNESTTWPIRLMPGIAILLVGVIVVFGTPRVIADAQSEAPWLRFRALAIDSKIEPNAEALTDERLNLMINYLETCVQIDPGNSRAMADLSILYLRRFEAGRAASDNPMSVSEIRNTVQSVEFESRREMLQWMAKAFGSRVEDLFRSLIAARASLSGQPLRASSYLVLHQLSFLIADNIEIQNQLMDQVLRVRPHDPAVRYAAGIADFEAGRLNDGASKLAFAFRNDRSLRQPILIQMMELIPIEEVVSLLEPDIEGLLQIFATCKVLNDESRTLWVAERFRQEFYDTQRPETFGFWFKSAELFRYLNESEVEISCLKQALIYRPQTYSVRRTLAFRLDEIGDSNEANTALRACLLRKPDDAEIKRRLQKGTTVIRHQRIASEQTN